MDPLIGALVAAVVAWASILVAAHLPTAGLPQQPLRLVGAGAIAIVGLIVLGVPLPGYLPVLWLLGGVAFVWLRPRGAAAA